MNVELLEILACPECQGRLRSDAHDSSNAEITTGVLRCLGCSAAYTVEDGIPRFSPRSPHRGIQNQVQTYSAWFDHYFGEASIRDPLNRDVFYHSLGIRAEDIDGKVVLDAGCGNGRFSFVVSQYRPKLLVAFDISSGLSHARRAISQVVPEANVAFVQGDVTRPPFKRGAFDIAFSWGVLHHTPDARRSFSAVSPLVKTGGKFGVYVYEFHPVYQYPRQALSLMAYLRQFLLIRPLRFFCSRLPHQLVRLLFLPIYYLERAVNIGVVGCHGPEEDKWNKNRYLATVIDRFKTRYASEHQLEEVVEWFAENQFNRLEVGADPRVSVTGTKRELSPGAPVEIVMRRSKQADESMARYRTSTCSPSHISSSDLWTGGKKVTTADRAGKNQVDL